MTIDQPVLGGEEDTSGLRARVMRETSPEGLLRAELKGLLGVDDSRRGANVDRLIGHSVQLNTIGWRIAQALGDVPEGAVEVDGDPVGLADRLIAEVERLRAEVNTTEAPLDASVYAERIAGVLCKKVWQHAKPETVAHARQVLEPEVRNLIFQVARAMAPTARAVFGDDEPAAGPSGGDTTLDEATRAAERASWPGLPPGISAEEAHRRTVAGTLAAWEVFTAQRATEVEEAKKAAFGRGHGAGLVAGKAEGAKEAMDRAEQRGREQAAQAVLAMEPFDKDGDDLVPRTIAVQLARGATPAEREGQGARVPEEGIAARMARRIAYRIRAELVCCDVYDRHAGTDRAGSEHAICFWGEAGARIAEDAGLGPDEEGYGGRRYADSARGATPTPAGGEAESGRPLLKQSTYYSDLRETNPQEFTRIFGDFPQPAPAPPAEEPAPAEGGAE